MSAARDELIASGHRRAGGRLRLGRSRRGPRSPGRAARRSTWCSSTGGGRCSARACRAATSATVLREAPCDVAVLVAREGAGRACRRPSAGRGRPVRRRRARLGGARARRLDRRRHGRAAEAARRRGPDRGGARASRACSATPACSSSSTPASAPEPVVAEGGREGVIEAAAGAGLLVIGLSDRWRQEGLGPTRSEIAKAAPAPVLFVRRGDAPGRARPARRTSRASPGPRPAWAAASRQEGRSSEP